MQINMIKTNIQLFLKHRFLLIFTIVFPIVFNIFFNLIFTSYEANQIPIGIIDEDQTKLSSEVMASFKNHPSLKIQSWDLEESKKLLKNNKIEAYFIIKEGFEAGIQDSNYNESIALYYLDKSSIGPALGDLIAAEVMMPLAIHKAANMSDFFAKTYQIDSLHDKTLELANFHKDENTFKMAINTHLKVPKLLAIETLDIQKILRLNMTTGFSLIVMSFVILFSNAYLVDPYFKSVQKRLVSTGLSRKIQYTLNLASVFINAFLLVIIEWFILCILLKVHTLAQIISIGMALCLYGAFLASLANFLSQSLNSVRIYQSILAPLLFVIGLFGGAFWSLEFLNDTLKSYTQLSPIAYPLKAINISLLNSGKYSFLEGSLGYIIFILLFNIIVFTVYLLKHNLRGHHEI